MDVAEQNLSANVPDWMREHVARYRATDGEEGYLWDSVPQGGKGLIATLLLTTTGRKSGKTLTLPLIFGRSGPNYVVVASKGGSPTHPAWFLNLEANPTVRVQVKAAKFRARARVATAAERPALWAAMVDIYPPYEAYQKRTPREIPIVILEPS